MVTTFLSCFYSYIITDEYVAHETQLCTLPHKDVNYAIRVVCKPCEDDHLDVACIVNLSSWILLYLSSESRFVSI